MMLSSNRRPGRFGIWSWYYPTRTESLTRSRTDIGFAPRGFFRVDKDIQSPIVTFVKKVRASFQTDPKHPIQKGANPRFHILFYRDAVADAEYWLTRE